MGVVDGDSAGTCAGISGAGAGAGYTGAGTVSFSKVLGEVAGEVERAIVVPNVGSIVVVVEGAGVVVVVVVEVVVVVVDGAVVAIVVAVLGPGVWLANPETVVRSGGRGVVEIDEECIKDAMGIGAV